MIFFEFVYFYLSVTLFMHYILNSNIYRHIILFVVFPTKGKGGPYSLSKYINIAIKKWNKHNVLSKKALLIHKQKLEMKSIVEILKSKDSYIWFERYDYLNFIKNSTYDYIFRKILYGPIVTPINWFNMPRNNTYEQYWCLVMKKIKAFITHSNRVKNHIIKSTKCYLHNDKYIILKPCIEIEYKKYNTYIFNERSIDFLVYIKYADINRKKDEIILINYLKNKYKIKIIEYGKHTKQSLLYLASISKYVIYFSFYDTGALSLLEIKMMGVWPIAHQKEFIEDGYGSYLKELDTNITSALSKLNDIYITKYNPHILSQNVVKNLNCVNSLHNIVKSLYQF